MEYYLSLNRNVIGPMTANQVMAYNVNPNVQVSADGINWSPLYTYPELMELYKASLPKAPAYAESNKTLVGIMALIFGGLGIQYFILGKVGGGFLTILLTLVTCGLWEVLTFVQGILILTMPEEEYRRKFVDSTSVMPLF